MQKRTIISALLVVAILLIGAIFWAFNRGVFYFEEGSAFPKFSRSAITNPVPSLDRETQFPADFPAEGRSIYETNIAELRTRLEKDKGDYQAWLDLAIYYRMVGDHDGAVEVWEYLRKTFPDDAVSRHNLGEHYFHEEKDYAKAEKYYEESIGVSSTLEANYTDMYEMYKYVYRQDTTAAIDILKRGIENMSGQRATQLKITLGREYRDRGDKENAKKYLTEARDEALSYGDRSIASELTKEISAL